jgi:hypothetical protein
MPLSKWMVRPATNGELAIVLEMFTRIVVLQPGSRSKKEGAHGLSIFI